MKLNLDRMLSALEYSSNPQNMFKSILIAGTNGKGSTTAYIEGIMRYHGFKTGRLTSPHILEYRERITIGGKRVSEKDLLLLYNEYKPLIEKLGLTFFEITTLFAFLLFKRDNVEWAILEVGLGGRLDATNTVNPSACVITGIGIDHEKTLGNTLRKIAGEKAGIIKKGTEVFLSAMRPDIREVFIDKARDAGAEVIYLPDVMSYKAKSISHDGTSFTFTFKGEERINAHLNMIGSHQIANAMLALLTTKRILGKSFSLDKALLALKDIVWHARFECLSHKPEVWLDVGHNLQGIKTIAPTMNAVFKDKKLLILLGALRDKKIELMANNLLKRGIFIALAPPESDRAPELGRLEILAERLKCPNKVFKNVTAAFAYLLKQAKDKDIPIFVIGSLYTAAEVYRYLNIKPDD